MLQQRSFKLLVVGAMMMASSNRLLGQEGSLKATVDKADGSYALAMTNAAATLKAGVAVQVDGRWFHAGDYPRHTVQEADAAGYLGDAKEYKVTYSGASGLPDLTYVLRVYAGKPFADIQVTVHNTTAKVLYIEGIRSVDAYGGDTVDLGGNAAEDRVLSDSWSEDRPSMSIHDLNDAKQQMHRAVGSQLIYNQQSRESLFLGALTSKRFVTVLRLHLDEAAKAGPHVASYEVDSTGTTELQMENSVEHSPAADQVKLRLPLQPGETLPAEQILFSIGRDYHEQLDTYGSLIRQIHHARTAAPPLMGWWSWTAYYFGLNEGAALTNAEWESEHIKSLGYTIFHIDEGYQYARGEYSTPNATLFPNGLAPVYYKVNRLGLTPGIWTAPFEVSERSWVHQAHPDWLVKNAQGQPIHAGTVEGKKDQLFVLDTTNPAAQDYLRETYATLVHGWGIRYIKMDFMDDSAIEGYYYKPNTTALEAERIGLKVIRDAVGEDVFLDKDGSPMLNPVGFVDYGRISQDTGHTFDASKEAATGIAARYYMNRNFFVADPDAFTVSTQTIRDQAWHESSTPASLDEARVSIALAAVSGGMFEIGDDLSSLSRDPARLALIENQDLINMIKLGKASLPSDLMSYLPEDQQPSIFLLKEDKRQTILTVFNWTEKNRDHSLDLQAFGLPATSRYIATDVLDRSDVLAVQEGRLDLHQPPHSVRVIKLIDEDVPSSPPVIEAVHPEAGRAGVGVAFSAVAARDAEPVLSYHWDFGDGVVLDGNAVQHTYTEPGDYSVRLAATGLDGSNTEARYAIHISGNMPTTFDPRKNTRLQPAH